MNLLDSFDVETRRQILKIIFYCFIIGILIGGFVAFFSDTNEESKIKIECNEK